MLTEIGFKCLFILSCLIPYLTVTHFNHQQTVIILTDKILHACIFLLQRSEFSIKQLILCDRLALTLYNRIELLINNLLTQTLHLDILHDLWTKSFISREALTATHLNDMITKRRKYRSTYLAWLQSKQSLLKLRYCLSFLKM